MLDIAVLLLVVAVLCVLFGLTRWLLATALLLLLFLHPLTCLALLLMAGAAFYFFLHR